MLDTSPALSPKSSHSDKRQRNRKTDTRWNDDEYIALIDRARETGLSLNAYIRAAVLGTPGPRARRTPPVNAEALGRATAALNKVGSNVNQIAQVANGGNFHRVAQECFAALAEVRAAAAAIREIVTERDQS